MTRTQPNLSKRRLVCLVVIAAIAPMGACDRGKETQDNQATPQQQPAPAAKSEPVPVAVSPSDITSTSGQFILPEVEPLRGTEELRGRVAAALVAAKEAPDDPQKLGELGVLYLVCDMSVPAASCLERAAELDPQPMRWWYYLGIAHERAYSFSQAVDAFQKALTFDEQYTPTLVRLAGLIMEPDVQSATVLLQRAVELAPDDARGYYGLGRCAELRGDPEEALQYYQQAVKTAPLYPAAYDAIARILSAAGQHKEAAEYAEKRNAGGSPPLVNDPLWQELLNKAGSADRQIQRAEGLAQAGQLDQAISLLEEVLAVDPTNTKARHSLGVVLALLRRYDEAAEQFQSILKANPDDINVSLDFGNVLATSGRIDEAEQVYRGILEREPHHKGALEHHGLLLLRRSRAEEAAATFRKLIEIGADDPGGYFNLATALVCLRQFDEATRQYKRVKELVPERTDVFDRLSTDLIKLMILQKEKPPAATEGPGALETKDLISFADALQAQGMEDEAEIIRGYPQILVRNALAIATRGDFDGAANLLQSVMSADIGGVIRNGLGAVYALQGRFQEAAQQSRLALEANPELQAAKTGLAHALTELGQYEEAERLFREVLERNPTDFGTHQNLGLLMFRQGKPDEALSLLGRAVALEPRNPASRYFLGELLLRMDKASEALVHLQEAVKLDPDNVRVRFMLGVALSGVGETAASEAQWRLAIQTNPVFTDAYMALVASALKKKDYAEVERLLRQGLKHAPDDVVLANGLAWTLATCPDEHRRNGGEAVQWAEKACDMTQRRSSAFVDTLAAAYAEVGRFEAAVKTEREAIALATQANQTGLLEEYNGRLALYEAGKPYHDED